MLNKNSDNQISSAQLNSSYPTTHIIPNADINIIKKDGDEENQQQENVLKDKLASVNLNNNNSQNTTPNKNIGPHQNGISYQNTLMNQNGMLNQNIQQKQNGQLNQIEQSLRQEEKNNEMAKGGFKWISKGVEEEFHRMMDYSKSSNVVQKYLVFREINVNDEQIRETSKKLKRANQLEIKFSNFNDFQFPSKKAMLESIVESIDYSQVAQPEQLKNRLLSSDFYLALEIFAQRFQDIFKWNRILLICQHIVIQIALVIGIVKQYSNNLPDLHQQLIIYLFLTLTLFIEFFLIYRSNSFLKKEGNDYLFIIAALVQAFGGIIAVSFETVRVPASITTLLYLLFLFSYLLYLLFLTTYIIPQFEFFKDTFIHFLYTEPTQLNPIYNFNKS